MSRWNGAESRLTNGHATSQQLRNHRKRQAFRKPSSEWDSRSETKCAYTVTGTAIKSFEASNSATYGGPGLEVSGQLIQGVCNVMVGLPEGTSWVEHKSERAYSFPIWKISWNFSQALAPFQKCLWGPDNKEDPGTTHASNYGSGDAMSTRWNKRVRKISSTSAEK